MKTEALTKRGTSLEDSKLAVPALFIAGVMVVHALALDPWALDPTTPKTLVLAVGLAIGSAMSAAHLQLKRPLPAWSLVDFLVAGFTTLIVVAEQGRAPAVGPVWPMAVLVSLVYASTRWLLAGLSTDRTLRLVAGVTVVVCVLNGFVYIVAPPTWRTTVTIDEVAFDQVAPGLVGTMGNPNVTAAWILIGFPAVAFLAWREKKVGIWRFCFVAFVVPALMATWCRSAWAAAALVIMILPGIKAPMGTKIMTWSSRIAVGVGLVIVLLLGGLALGGGWKLTDLTTLGRRVTMWTIAGEGVLSAPVVGWGPGGFERLLVRSLPSGQPSTPFVHCIPLQVWGDVGVGGLLALVALVVFLLSSLFNPHRGDGARLAALGCLAFLGDGLVNIGPVAPAALPWFAVVTAVAVDGRRGERSQRFRSATLVALAGCFLLLVPVFLLDWSVAREQHALRIGIVPVADLERSILVINQRPGWLRGRYDAAGRLAQAERFVEASFFYALVEARIPGWQDLHTNRAIIGEFLSGSR